MREEDREGGRNRREIGRERKGKGWKKRKGRKDGLIAQDYFSRQ